MPKWGRVLVLSLLLLAVTKLAPADVLYSFPAILGGGFDVPIGVSPPPSLRIDILASPESYPGYCLTPSPNCLELISQSFTPADQGTLIPLTPDTFPGFGILLFNIMINPPGDPPGWVLVQNFYDSNGLIGGGGHGNPPLAVNGQFREIDLTLADYCSSSLRTCPLFPGNPISPDFNVIVIWDLTILGTPVPEPGSLLMVIAAMALWRILDHRARLRH